MHISTAQELCSAPSPLVPAASRAQSTIAAGCTAFSPAGSSSCRYVNETRRELPAFIGTHDVQAEDGNTYILRAYPLRQWLMPCWWSYIECHREVRLTSTSLLEGRHASHFHLRMAGAASSCRHHTVTPGPGSTNATIVDHIDI